MTFQRPDQHAFREAELALMRLLVRQGCHKINNHIMMVETQMALAEMELDEPEALGKRILEAREALRALKDEVVIIHTQAREDLGDGLIVDFPLRDLTTKLQPYLMSPTINRPAWQVVESTSWEARAAGDLRHWHRAVLLLMESFLSVVDPEGAGPRLTADDVGGRVELAFEAATTKREVEASPLFQVGSWLAYEIGLEGILQDLGTSKRVRYALTIPG